MGGEEAPKGTRGAGAPGGGDWDWVGRKPQRGPGGQAPRGVEVGIGWGGSPKEDPGGDPGGEVTTALKKKWSMVTPL